MLDYLYNFFNQDIRKCVIKNNDYYYLSLLKNKHIVNGYSIHGLWPQYKNGKYPSYCKKVEFDINELKSIEKDLISYWELPEDCDKLETSFWKHEWEKHGSCMFSEMSELEYFTKALNLYEKVMNNNIDIEKYKQGNNYLIPFDLNFNVCV